MERELWLLWAALAISFLYYLTFLKWPSGNGRQPPGPRPLPVIGNLLDLRRGNLHHTLVHLARIHGPVMFLKMGLTTTVVISSRDAAREAFTRHDRRLAARTVRDSARVPGFFDRSVIWLPSSDQRWKTMRSILATHVVSPRSLAMVRGVRERKVRDLVSYIRGRAGQELDVGLAVYGGVINLRPLDLQGRRRWAAKVYGKVFRVLDDVIDRRLAEDSLSKTKRDDDFLDVLLQLTSTGTITRADVRAIMFDVFTAGSDTISITVVWAMAELLRNPGIMAKVRAEIEDALGSKETIDENDAMSLPYLQAVVKEAMRLHPAGPILLPHEAVENGVEIEGYTVPKGCSVIFNVWAIMRDPAAWERPDEFAPERWFLNGTAEVNFRAKDFEFIPFGSGRRICPGVPIVERVLPHILVSLLHAFEWKLPNGMSAEQLDVSEKFTTANVMAVPLKAVPIVIT
ncbi:hypothetical protein PR202_ga21200 [Eleusine coracana subsp. coracana]|uniref:Uncharacterized protein n=1 Tax=Eleusine coracana subsp. coracana TaxID=191504 RepID=A0AAV5D0C6_ELECO|nr:hypothetical protein PR202_ga21200 [Eleusine coracana subsp. coracana]